LTTATGRDHASHTLAGQLAFLSAIGLHIEADLFIIIKYDLHASECTTLAIWTMNSSFVVYMSMYTDLTAWFGGGNMQT